MYFTLAAWLVENAKQDTTAAPSDPSLKCHARIIKSLAAAAADDGDQDCQMRKLLLSFQLFGPVEFISICLAVSPNKPINVQALSSHIGEKS